MGVTRRKAQKLVGKLIYAVRKDGTSVHGKLVRISGNRLWVRAISRNGKRVKTSALIPLVLYDLLAIGTSPFAYGGYPYGYGYGYGYPYGAPYGYGGGFFL